MTDEWSPSAELVAHDRLVGGWKSQVAVDSILALRVFTSGNKWIVAATLKGSDPADLGVSLQMSEFFDSEQAANDELDVLAEMIGTMRGTVWPEPAMRPT